MHIMIVGTFDGSVKRVTQALLVQGHQVTALEHHQEALAHIEGSRRIDLVFIELSENIPAFLKAVSHVRTAPAVIACGVGRVDRKQALQAIKAGARDYVPFPADPEIIVRLCDTCVRSTHSFLFQDPIMQPLLTLADKIAPTQASVLITGESGTGKEVMAQYIHAQSRRSSRRMISVNCAAIPDTLLESELFGHEKGAFTGALSRRVGKFEEANGGTLLLDEITEMHPRLQSKLLRAIQERQIDRVGGQTPVSIDFRLIATSNRNMQEAVEQGVFREDLFFRLNVVNIHLPALRERPGDIQILAQHFLHHYTDLNNLAPRTFAKDVLSALQAHTWPGNVRELENTIHRAVLVADDPVICVEDLGLSRSANTPAPSVVTSLETGDTSSLKRGRKGGQ